LRAGVQEKTLRTLDNYVIYYRTSPEEAFMRRIVVSAACILLFSASFAHADFYRYVDGDGKEFFTNDLKQVPQQYRSSAKPVQTDDSRVSIGDKPAAPGKSTGSVKEHKDKNGKGERYWRGRADKLRMKLRDLQDDYDLVMKQLDDPAQKTSTGKKKSRSSLVKKKQKIEKDMTKTKRKLEVDLPEEARRADAYPGWVRE
jgi:hypothetical protein